MEFAGNLLFNIFGIIIAIVVITIAWFKRRYRYWRNLGVIHLEPTIPVGNAGKLFLQQKSVGDWTTEFYNFLKSRNVIHGGMYFLHKPIYFPIDLDLIKQIIQVDFAYFMDRGAYVNEKDDPLSANLSSLEGQRWRNLRAMLTPTFTSGKMKNMFPIMVQISQELVKVLEQQCQECKPVEAKDISARLTTDIIGNCAFGIDCNSLLDPNVEFRVQGKRMFNLTWSESLSNFFSFLFPDLAKNLGVRLLPKDAADFFWKVIKGTTEYREQNDIRRNDAMQLLLDMKNKEAKDNEAGLSFNEIAAQAFVFFAGGFETSSTLMSFALLELAANEDVQNILREEINLILKKNCGEFTYEGLAEMNYLSMVINETLRKYPPLPILTRICTKDYRVPDTDIVITKNHMVFIPVRGIHYDPEYYADPEKFDPTRFNEENKSKRHQFAFLPFGEGPRICIGLRFGMMQAKLGLATIVKNFKIKLNSQTKLPIKLEIKNFFTTAEGGVWIDLERIG